MRGQYRRREKRTKSSKASTDDDDEDGQGDNGGTPPEGQQQQQQGQQQQELTWDTWLEAQDEGVKGLVDGELKGLKSALEAERRERKSMEKQLREAAAKLEKGSEKRASLEQQADRLQEMEHQTAFYDAAHAAGVLNLRLAWLAARDAGLVSEKDGSVDVEKLREQFPQLFAPARQQPPPGNAGAGTQTGAPAGGGMNAFIRTAAGRRP